MSQVDGEAEDRPGSTRVQQHASPCILRHLLRRLRGYGKGAQSVRDRGRWRLSVALALALGLALAALAAPAGAATGHPDAVSRADKQSLRIWAYFDGDTPVTGARVRVYAGGRELRERGGPGPVRTLSGGTAFLRFRSLPPRLRIVVSGGRAGGRPVRGSLKTKVRGVSDGELVDVNPVTTVTDVWAHSEEGRSHRRARNVVERTLGIKRRLDDYDLYVNDQWFNGDRFHRWTLEQGSVGAGARALVDHIDEPGFDRRVFRSGDGGGGGGPEASVAANPLTASADTVLDGLIDHIATKAAETGPEGVVFGIALKGLKSFFGALAGKAEETPKTDPIADALKDIAAQVSKIEVQIDNQFFALQNAQTTPIIRKIEGAEKDLQDALRAAKEATKKGASKEDRENQETAFNTALSSFITNAHSLHTDHAADGLHKDLVGDPKKPETPGLISGLRSKLGNQKFFTSQSSTRIRDYFSYYEWMQVRLATVLSEFHMLGGRCVKDTSDKTCKYDSNGEPKPDPITARVAVENIQENIDAQLRALPSKLNPLYFIDTKTNLEWRTEATFWPTPNILAGGIDRSACTFSVPQPGGYQKPQTCHADLNKKGYEVQFKDVGVAKYWWRIPTAAEAQSLFTKSPDAPDDPLTRLNSLGVNYPTSQVHPAASGKSQFNNDDLWLRDSFTTISSAPYDRMNIDARVLRLGPKRAPELVDKLRVAENCSASPTPSCNKIFAPGQGANSIQFNPGFILWVRNTSRAETAFLW